MCVARYATPRTALRDRVAVDGGRSKDTKSVKTKPREIRDKARKVEIWENEKREKWKSGKTERGKNYRVFVSAASIFPFFDSSARDIML